MLFYMLLGTPLQSPKRGQGGFIIVSVIRELRERGAHSCLGDLTLRISTLLLI